jgi:(+)-neomenthol dehydrogenase
MAEVISSSSSTRYASISCRVIIYLQVFEPVLRTACIARLPLQRIAVVTGGNKGIGLEVCRQLTQNGVTDVLTARDEKRGMEAVEKPKGLGISGDVLFHQLDVMDVSSIARLAEFLKARFGRLDILVKSSPGMT